MQRLIFVLYGRGVKKSRWQTPGRNYFIVGCCDYMSDDLAADIYCNTLILSIIFFLPPARLSEIYAFSYCVRHIAHRTGLKKVLEGVENRCQTIPDHPQTNRPYPASGIWSYNSHWLFPLQKFFEFFNIWECLL